MSTSIERRPQDFRATRLVILTLAAVAFSALIGTAAWASARDEQQGAQLLSTIHAGKLNSATLSSSKYERWAST